MTLIVAAGGGQLELVQALLKCGADPRLREPDGTRALDWAAQEGHREVVDALLAYDRSLLDLPGLYERTPLMAAAGNGHVDLVGVLLSRGADPRRRMARGARALDWAADEGHVGVVELLLTHDPGLLDLPGFGDCTALMAAAAKGHVDLARQLLARGADPSLREMEGTRALDWAAQNGHAALVELLLAHDPSLLDQPGLDERTALMAAAARGHPGLVRQLLACGADPARRKNEGTRALDWAAQEGHQEVAFALLAQQGGLLDLPGHGERTPLMAAAANGHVRLTLRLLARGADPRQRKEEGTRALDWAAQNGHQAVVEHLLHHDPALLDLPGHWERTALIAAASNGHAELVRALLARGADARAREGSGTRALDWAAQEGHLAAVRLLLEHDPGLIDLPGYGERTALVAASGNGHIEVVSFLLAAGADVRARRSSGAHAMDSAAQEGHHVIVEMLLAHDPGLLDLPGAGERTALMAAAAGNRLLLTRQLLSRGADPTLRESEGTHALDWAAQNGHQAVVDLLLSRDPGLLEMPGFGERTALAAAAGSGHVELVGSLLGRGADPRRRREGGAHALDAAAQDGHVAVVERLLSHDPGLLDLPGSGGRTALMAAAVNNRVEVAQQLLARGADPAARDAEGTRALDWACLRGFKEVAEVLLAHDASLLDLPGYGERTPLIAAACNGHTQLVAWLLARGADPRQRESEGTHALDWAAQEGHLAVVELLLAHDPLLVDLPGYTERTALIAAADNGHAPLVALLLEWGADARRRRASGAHALDSAAQGGHQELVEQLLAHDPGLLALPGREGRTALIAAAANSHEGLVRWLLAHGADARAATPEGITALDCAAQAGDVPVTRHLLEHDPLLADLPGYRGRTALIAASGNGHAELVRLLLALGADPRIRDATGARALDWAAQNGSQAVVELLLAHDPSLRDLPGYDERTALMAAAANNHLPLTQWLLAQGADLRRRESEGAHALDWAAQNGHQRIVECLLCSDPDLVNLPGYGGRTALMAAASNGHAALVACLLTRGADPRLRKPDGTHALDWAAQNGHLQVVGHLLDHDPALLDLPGYRERTALSAAASSGHAELVRTLLARGADPWRRRTGGAHALDLAADGGHQAVVELLLAHDRHLLELPGYIGRTALIAAAGSGHADLVRELLTRGASPRKQRQDGANALYWAARNGHQAVVDLLVEADGGLLHQPVLAPALRPVDLRRLLAIDFGETSTRMPAGSSLIEVLILARKTALAQALLCRHGGLINKAGIAGATPLMLCAATGQPGLLAWLLAQGADPVLRDESGDHALLYALDRKAADCVRILVEHEPRLLHLAGRGGRVAAELLAGLTMEPAGSQD